MLSRVLEYWHTLRYWPLCWKAILRFRGYRPQAVTMRSITRWLSQFDAKDRTAVLLLLDKVVYLSEKHTEKTLVELNERLLARLNADGVPTRNIVYMQIHDPGSSSAAMLNMLRDRACLEQKGCHFVDWKDIRQLHEVTDRLEQGAIIYVDDFSATGGQFCTVRNYLAEYIVGNFSEFFLLPIICEEALYKLGTLGVEAISGDVHSKAARPLHPNSTILNPITRSRLVELCTRIDQKGGLGVGQLATMVVFYRNAPNTVPVLLRGNRKRRFAGVFPRTTDL